MAVADFYGRVVARVGDSRAGVKCRAVAGVGDSGTGVNDPGYNGNPVASFDFKFVTDKILCVANNDAVVRRVDFNNVTRPERSTGQTFSLSDGEELYALVFRNEIAVDIVDLTAMKVLGADVRPQKRLVIVSGNKTDFLAVGLFRDFQA